MIVINNIRTTECEDYARIVERKNSILPFIDNPHKFLQKRHHLILKVDEAKLKVKVNHQPEWQRDNQGTS